MEWGNIFKLQIRTAIAGIFNKSMQSLRLLRLLGSIPVVWLGLWLNAGAAPKALYDEYFVSLDPKLTRMHINACFNGPPPTLLRAGSGRARDFLLTTGFGNQPSGQNLSLARAGIEVQRLSAAGCLEYDVDFSQVRRQHDNSRRHTGNAHDMGTTAGHWLWLPESNKRPVRIRFSLPGDLAVSAPWRLIERQEHSALYEIDPDADTAGSRVYIGDFIEHDIEVTGARIRLAIMGRPSAHESEKIANWIRYGTEAMVALYGSYPLPEAQIVVFPIGPYHSAVPWGEVRREGGSVAKLYVDQTRPLSELIGDWTLVHELCHMMHPYLDMTGRWISEGFATYYQNVLQARVGTLTPERAWIKLHEGFQRGIQETETGKKLITVSANMRSNRNYMRVYWSGVALALKADWILRNTGRGSLDEVLKAFGQCCLEEHRTWTPEQFIGRLDELSDSNIFSTLYHEYAYSDRFPDLRDVYQSLGLVARGNKVAFSDDATGAPIRKSIMHYRQ